MGETPSVIAEGLLLPDKYFPELGLMEEKKKAIKVYGLVKTFPSPFYF